MNLTMVRKPFIACLLLLAGFLPTPQLFSAEEEEEEGEAEEPTGPHSGRLLENGDYQVELAIVEGDEPEFRAWAYRGEDLVDPTDWQLTLSTRRLSGETSEFRFTPEGDYLKSEESVEEPHSFDLTLDAQIEGEAYSWEFESYEGRVEIESDLADEHEIGTAIAGPGTLRQTVLLYGLTTPDPLGVSHVTARYAGLIRRIDADLGEHVEAGQTLAVIEANTSLQSYTITAPISGTVIQRHANPGEFTGDQPLLTIADYSRVWADLDVFPGDADIVRAGQAVTLTMETLTAESNILYINPGEGDSPNVIARVPLDNAEGLWTPGLLVEGNVVVAEFPVALRIDNRALQTLEGEQGVFIKIGESYEFTALELGARDLEFTEVVEGLDAGDEYVSLNSFLLKADVEKANVADED